MLENFIQPNHILNVCLPGLLNRIAMLNVRLFKIGKVWYIFKCVLLVNLDRVPIKECLQNDGILL